MQIKFNSHEQFKSFNTLEEFKQLPEVKKFSDRVEFYQFSVQHVYAMCSGPTKSYTYWNLIVEFDHNDWWERVGYIFEATLNDLITLGISEHDDWVHEFAHKMTPPMIILPELYSTSRKEWKPPSDEDVIKYFERLRKHNFKRR